MANEYHGTIILGLILIGICYFLWYINKIAFYIAVILILIFMIYGSQKRKIEPVATGE